MNLVNYLMLVRQVSLSPPSNVDLMASGELQIVFSAKLDLLFLLYLMVLDVFYSPSDVAYVSVKTFAENPNLMTR